MPVMSDASTFAARAQDQAHARARDHALRVGASGRGEVSPPNAAAMGGALRGPLFAGILF